MIRKLYIPIVFFGAALLLLGAAAGNKYFGSFTGDGSGLTNLTGVIAGGVVGTLTNPVTTTGNLTGSVITATSRFQGPGTGLTGTAAGFTAAYLVTNSSGQIVFTNSIMNTNPANGNWAQYNASSEVRSNFTTGSYFIGTNGTALWTNPAAAKGVYINGNTGTIYGEVATARWTPTVLYGTNIVLDITNGNLQTLTLTAATWIALSPAVTNYVETIRLNIWNSNTVTWATGNLSNYTSTATTLSTNATSLLFDHMNNTNLWWAYKLR